jgi:DNA-binding XRE family transcriptional regulator
MKPNRKGEEILFGLIQRGKFTIDDQGRIWKGNKRAEHKTPSGYLQLRSMVNGIRYYVGAHRLVWIFFNGPIPDGMLVNHKNGQKDDNRPWNLELNTYSENIRHAHQNGLLDQTGQKNPAAKLTNKQIAEIRLAYANGGYTQKQLAQKYGVSYQCISKVVRGDRRAKQPGKTGDYSSRRQSNSKRDPVTGQFIGKKAAGYLLDGEEHRQFPGVQITD